MRRRYGCLRKWKATCVATILALAGTRTVSGQSTLPNQRPQAASGKSDTVVRMVSRPKYTTATLHADLTIGTSDGAPEYSLTRVLDILPARDGSVIVADVATNAAGTSFIRQYDGLGKYIRTIGRRGQGPGEYITPIGLAQLRDGRILVRDAPQRRINVYDSNGESIGTLPLASGMRWTGAMGMIIVDTADIIYVRDQIRLRTPAEPGPPFGLVRMRADGTTIDTLVAPELTALTPPLLEARSARGSSRSTPIPYQPSVQWAWSPLGYFVTGVTNRYAIDLRLPPASRVSRGGPPAVWLPGDPVMSIRNVSKSVPVSDSERAARRAGLEAFMRAIEPQWTWYGPAIPRIKPAYGAITVGTDGTIWVTVSVPSEPYTPLPSKNPTGRDDTNVPFHEPTVFDVFEPDGTYLGRVLPPARTTLRVFSRDTVWAIESDMDDVQRVKRFRVTWR